MKLPIETRTQSPFNQMVELGVPVRAAKAVSEMLALPGTKTASRVLVGKCVKEARSMLCGDMVEGASKVGLQMGTPTPGPMAMAEEEEELTEEEEALQLGIDTAKLAYSVSRNMGHPKEAALVLAIYAYTRLV
jgi:hypothetical protein